MLATGILVKYIAVKTTAHAMESDVSPVFTVWSLLSASGVCALPQLPDFQF